MNNEYELSYTYEYSYRKKERILKKFNMLSYKKLVFNYYPELKKGHFLGSIISNDDIKTEYILELPTERKFKLVYDSIKLHYTVYKQDKKIVVTNITPKEIFKEEYSYDMEFLFHKGVIVPPENKEKYIFKIDLLDKVGK